MHFKGVELTKQKTIKYCSDNTCINLIPICCLCLTHDCSENSTKWHHISAGEHVCSACYNYLYSSFSYEVDNLEVNAWKEDWIARSHETPTILDFITSTLLSNWYMCSECGKWRQANRDISLCPSQIYRFTCKMIIKHTQSPCKISEDERIEFIRNHPGSFFDSVKYTAYLNNSPFIEVYDEYQLDTIGILPIAKNDFNFDEPCEGFMSVFNPFSKENKLQVTAGAIDPTSMDKWEHDFFQTFGGNLRNIFIGLRNLVFLLWSADPKKIIDTNILSKCFFIRGLIKVALLINSVPDMIRIYSSFGYINFGFPNGDINLFDDFKKKEVIIVGAGLSALAAARHLSLLGVNVTVLEANEKLDDNLKFSMKLSPFDCLNEVFGVINNPFSIMAYQCGIELREVSTNLSIFDLNGDIIPDDVDQFYQNLVYNFVAYLMEGSSVIRDMSAYNNWSLADLYRDYRRLRISKNFVRYDAVEHVYLSEIEYRVYGGASMESIPRDIPVPCMSRNMFNFSYKQFSGITMEPVLRNWNKVFQKLTSCLDIRYSKRVSTISRAGKKYVISTGDTEAGEQFQADKILFAMSPWNYCKIVSEPDWLTNRSMVDEDVTVETKTISDDQKDVDINSSGSNTFIIVQMAYHSNDLFWRHKIPTNSSERAFAIVPASGEMRGFCHLFKETKVIEEENLTILQTKIFGLASKMISNMSDEEIIRNILDKLRPLSDRPDGPPQPKWYEISKIDNALQSCTDLGIKYRQLFVTQQFQEDIFVTNKSDILAEPISLSNSFCVGMDAASSILKTFL